ncbi:MAG: SHOCT domain-containing protein [Bacteroidota bacterium]
MLSKELIAQAQLAYSNWKYNNPGQAMPMSEDDYIQRVTDLQALYNKGLLKRDAFDARMEELLKDPPMAVNVAHFQAPQASTESLLQELQRLHKSGVLTDDEFEERKSELYYQRDVQPDPDAEADENEAPEARRTRLLGLLDELLREGVLTQIEYESGKSRLDH